MIFKDRREAGRLLAEKLRDRAGPDVVVLGLPRGGVPVAYEVAERLGAPLDVFVVRKLGHPLDPELAIGAVATGGVRVFNRELVQEVDRESLDAVIAKEQAELARRERAYRGARPALELSGRTAIVVDDGLATGASMTAAVAALRKLAPARVVVAVPVGAPEICAALRRRADEVVCVQEPEAFSCVGEWYERFEQTQDEEVAELLQGDRHAAQS